MLQAQQLIQGRYQLQQQLGQNPGRQTWLAQDVGASPEASVILKLLAFNPTMQWDEFKLFEREAQVLKQLNHPQIPKYRDYFSLDQQVGGGLYWFGLVQQHIPGASVRQLLDGGKRFSQAEVKTIAQSVLEILIYLHGLNPSVLHRDIKPSNLILGDDEQVYLVDFGAVQNSAATEGVTFTVVGTTGYAPLEQFWGKAVPASDLYALGATLIHLLTGTPPADLPQQDLRIQFSDRVSIDPHFTDWIKVLTAPDLEQRFTNASEALAALRSNRSPKIAIITNPQPPGSRVKLKKSTRQLSIKIPKPKRSLLSVIKLGGNLFLTVCSLPLLLVLGSILLVLGIGLFAALVYSPAVLFILLPLILLMGWLLRDTNRELGKLQEEVAHALRHLFGHHCLYLDRQHFIIEQELFGLSYLRHVGQTSEIQKVNQIPFMELVLETQMVSYSFGQELTENERRWLTHELQNWLDE
ncbi:MULTISPECIES: serine/threonine protein kinase [unclassified Coleofasciculus]|uniref:serine/threonine protein kinase n=2 Tax=unclassified Coleofasciculus TaxID=2692782 RepID=UPI00187F53CA|nr:serine/threonine protein kinase [Coleofasciculus sp. LEGE 07081]MBE9148159.1 serine/threonine protein kinase [Coleofasciculus sp. LEGE 07092]